MELTHYQGGSMVKIDRSTRLIQGQSQSQMRCIIIVEDISRIRAVKWDVGLVSQEIRQVSDENEDNQISQEYKANRTKLGI